jgi:hypothetical protein
VLEGRESIIFHTRLDLLEGECFNEFSQSKWKLHV